MELLGGGEDGMQHLGHDAPLRHIRLPITVLRGQWHGIVGRGTETAEQGWGPVLLIERCFGFEEMLEHIFEPLSGH